MVVHGIQAFSAARLQYSMTDYMFKPFLFGLNPPDVRRCDTVLCAPLLDDPQAFEDTAVEHQPELPCHLGRPVQLRAIRGLMSGT